MVVASAASPFCTWLVAACMTVSSENKYFNNFSKEIERQKRLGRSVRRGCLVALSNKIGGINSLMNFCRIEPCEEYRSSHRLSSSCTLFGESAFAVLGSKNRGRNQLTQADDSSKFLRPVLDQFECFASAPDEEKPVAAMKKLVSKKRRVVVTGLGVVSPLGHNVDEFYGNLLEGISGVSQIEAFDCAEFPTRIAGEIKNFTADGCVSPKLAKRADKYMLYLLSAGKRAFADGKFSDDVVQDLDKAKCGVVIGSAIGGMKVFGDAIEALRVSHKKMNPFCVPFSTTNIGSAILAMDLGWLGPNYSISAACATSNISILSAANHIIRGEVDVMLCGGSDSAITPIGLGGFSACGILSRRNDEPTKASCPWDMQRDGFVMGEGAGVLLLEELNHAMRRGATIYAEFLGGSSTFHAHPTDLQSHCKGYIRCVETALVESGMTKEDVNYINAHAASTPTFDFVEYQSMLHSFGQNTELRMNSTKSMTGHLLGAAGAIEAIATIKAIETRWIHPTINLEYPDRGMDSNVLVGNKKERLDIRAALSNSFGFGGHNSSIIFAPFLLDE